MRPLVMTLKCINYWGSSIGTLGNSYIVICWFMQKHTHIYWIHTDAMIKTDAGRLLYKYMYLSFYLYGSKRLFKFCVWVGDGDRTETAIFWPSLLWPPTLCLSRSTNAQPEALGSTLLGAGFTASYQHLLWTPIQSGLPGAPSAGCSFPYHNSSMTPSPTLTGTGTWFLSWLGYIIVQRSLDRPLERPLDLWNGMFDHHQAEITVIQFTGHSLLVNQSMSVPWEFLSSSHFISQFPPTRFPLITAIRMCHFLPVHLLEWHFGPGRRSKYNTGTSRSGKFKNNIYKIFAYKS